jgi:hypothetical protein
MGRNAFHQHSHRRWAAHVKLAIDGDVRLGALGDPSRLSSVGRVDLIKEVGQQGCLQLELIVGVVVTEVAASIVRQFGPRSPWSGGTRVGPSSTGSDGP